MVVEKKEPVYVSFNQVHKLTDIEKLCGDVFLFDIDKTLYAHDIPILKYLRNSFEDFFQKKNIFFKQEDFKKLKIDYKSVSRGFIRKYDVKKEDYEQVILDAKYEEIIFKNEILQKQLESIKNRKWCVTNASLYHARHVLQLMGIEDLFEVVIHVDFYEDVLLWKPMAEIYQQIENILQVREEDRRKLHFFDDLESNIVAAKERGWTTYFITENKFTTDFLKEILIY